MTIKKYLVIVEIQAPKYIVLCIRLKCEKNVQAAVLQKSTIKFFFEQRGQKTSVFRQKVLILGSIAFFFCFLVFLVYCASAYDALMTSFLLLFLK